METAILRLHCRDVKGIVFHVSRFIYEHNGNIINAEQHAEPITHRFFMRVYFDCSELNCTRENFQAGLRELAGKFEMDAELTFSDQRKRMAIMVSKYDHCLYDLLLRHQYGEINADLALIVSNHRDLESVASAFHIPFFHVPVTVSAKAEAEAKTLALFEAHQVDFIVLARYMQILTDDFTGRYENRIINVHHGFLPAFKGAKPYHQAYGHGVKIIGATSHYATAELDMGPIIEQETIRVDHTHSVEAMVAMGRDLERNVLASAVKAHAADRIMVYQRRTIVFR
ncbi:MAG TPA: formyltetrahydrofolate deformylase [Candidatus Hydrogenedentes bacterium]|nr:formyltetrahydrofolate deformylase [Candidatus Hydrogenedentota bacterium]